MSRLRKGSNNLRGCNEGVAPAPLPSEKKGAQRDTMNCNNRLPPEEDPRREWLGDGEVTEKNSPRLNQTISEGQLEGDQTRTRHFFATENNQVAAAIRPQV